MTEPLSPPDPPEECVCEYCGAELLSWGDEFARARFKCSTSPDEQWRSFDCYEREIEQLKEQNKALLKGSVVTGLVEALRDYDSHCRNCAGNGYTVTLHHPPEQIQCRECYGAKATLAAYDEAVKGGK